MAREVGNIAPFINKEFYVTSTFGESRSGGRTHNGVDIATSLSQRVYSISDGVVHYKGYDSLGYGYYVIIKTDDNIGFLYAHLATQTSLQLGERVEVGEFIANEGTTGVISTGVHLHLEIQRMINGEWNFYADLSGYRNPCIYMGITNEVDGTAWIYNGTPYIKPKKKKKFPWVLYARKIRNKQN